MSLKVKVKVGTITNLSDARYCAGMGVNMLGFPVGSTGLTPAIYRQIIDWVSGPEFVLEMSAGTDLNDVKTNYPGHYVQISKEHLHLLNDRTIQFIVSIDANEWPILGEQLIRFQTIQYLEVSAGKDDLPLVKEINRHFPVLLRIENTVELDAYLETEISGIALKGGQEDRPGVKDYSSLSDILERIED